MDMWLKIGSAVLLGIFIIMLIPQAKHMLTNSPEAEPGDWPAFIMPLLAIGGFVALLMWLV